VPAALNDELTEWKHLGPVFEHHDREVINVECPNLFRLDGRWVLIISPHKPCQYFVGSLDVERVRFEPETRGVLDPGGSYASNISRDDQGRTILWLWGKTELPEARGWNGVMVMPRILTVGADGFLRQQPAPEFEKVRGQPITLKPADLSEKPLVLSGVEGDALEIEAEFSGRRASSIGLELRRSADGKVGTVVSVSGAGILTAGKAGTLIGENERCKLRIFLDKRVMEVYANDGQAAIFTNVEAGPRDLAIAAFAKGGKARLESFRAWPLKAAQFNFDRYKL
jgi:beta-fructofuranosidase